MVCGVAPVSFAVASLASLMASSVFFRSLATEMSVLHVGHRMEWVDGGYAGGSML